MAFFTPESGCVYSDEIFAIWDSAYFSACEELVVKKLVKTFERLYISVKIYSTFVIASIEAAVVRHECP